MPKDVAISGIEAVTDIGGGQVRVTYYVNRRAEDGRLERVTMSHAHVMPAEGVFDAMGKSLAALGRRVMARENGISVTH